MLASKALRRSRTAMEMASSPGIRETPSGRTRYSDSAKGSGGSIQNRHQPADSQPRNWASTGAACPGWGAGGSARMVMGTAQKPSNAAKVTSKFGDALSTKRMNGVIPDIIFWKQERRDRFLQPRIMSRR